MNINPFVKRIFGVGIYQISAIILGYYALFLINSNYSDEDLLSYSQLKRYQAFLLVIVMAGTGIVLPRQLLLKKVDVAAGLIWSAQWLIVSGLIITLILYCIPLFKNNVLFSYFEYDYLIALMFSIFGLGFFTISASAHKGLNKIYTASLILLIPVAYLALTLYFNVPIRLLFIGLLFLGFITFYRSYTLNKNRTVSTVMSRWRFYGMGLLRIPGDAFFELSFVFPLLYMNFIGLAEESGKVGVVFIALRGLSTLTSPITYVMFVDFADVMATNNLVLIRRYVSKISLLGVFTALIITLFTLVVVNVNCISDYVGIDMTIYASFVPSIFAMSLIIVLKTVLEVLSYRPLNTFVNVTAFIIGILIIVLLGGDMSLERMLYCLTLSYFLWMAISISTLVAVLSFGKRIIK